MAANRLKLNAEKTELLWAGSGSAILEFSDCNVSLLRRFRIRVRGKKLTLHIGSFLPANSGEKIKPNPSLGLTSLPGKLHSSQYNT